MDNDELTEGGPGESAAATDDALAEHEAQLAAAREAGRAAIERTRELLLASAPGVPAELVTGETLAEVEESFARANALVERVQRDVQVGPGAPGRITMTPGTPFEKIRAGLATLE